MEFSRGFNLSNQSHTYGLTFSILDRDITTFAPDLRLWDVPSSISRTMAFHFQHYYGFQQNARAGQKAEWYSLVNYLSYDINSKWKQL